MWMALWAISMFLSLILFVLGLVFGVVKLVGGLVDSFLARYSWLLLAIGIVALALCNIGERISRLIDEKDRNKKLAQNQGSTLKRTGTGKRM